MKTENIVFGEKSISKRAKVFNTLPEPQTKNAIIAISEIHDKTKAKMLEKEKEKIIFNIDSDETIIKQEDNTIIKPEDVEKMKNDNEIQYLVNREIDFDERLNEDEK